jgi:hypothetical protein
MCAIIIPAIFTHLRHLHASPTPQNIGVEVVRPFTDRRRRTFRKFFSVTLP